MMKKAARKDFYMEIRKSWGRFFSILFIVALGVAFFSGIRASEPDMRLSGDSYFDDSELMDIKALGTYGVTEADVEAMGELEGVELAEGAYSGDYLYTTDEEQRVLHVMSLQEHMNQVAVREGCPRKRENAWQMIFRIIRSGIRSHWNLGRMMIFQILCPRIRWK